MLAQSDLPEARAALSRRTVIDAAVGRLDAGAPLSSLTIRALADELGVTPMALYRHVVDKDDLLLEVIDRLLQRSGLPTPDADWRSAVLELVDSLRDLLARHPTMVQIFCRRPVTTPAAISRLRSGVSALERGGFSTHDAVEAWAAINIFVIGFSAIEAGRAAFAAEHPGPPADNEEARIIANFPGEGPFRRGLMALIDGLGNEHLTACSAGLDASV